MTFASALYDGLFADPEIAALWNADAQTAHMLAFEAAFSRAMGQAGRFLCHCVSSISAYVALAKAIAWLALGTPA